MDLKFDELMHIAPLAALAGCALAIVLRGPAEKLGLVDVPHGHKQHGAVVPLVGGVSIALTILAATAVVVGYAWGHTLHAGIMLLVAGMIDDRRPLSVRTRLILQIAAAAWMVYGGLRVESLGALGELGIWAVPFTLLAIVAFINACNMVDGADGLLTAALAPACVAIALVSDPPLATKASLLAGALVGFGLVNWPAGRGNPRRHLRTFLGNGGVMFVAVAAASLLIEATQGRTRVMFPGTVPWLTLIPLAELANTCVRRIVRQVSPTSADRMHFHHRLMRRGLSPQQLAWTYLAIATAGCAMALYANARLVDGRPLWLGAAMLLGTATLAGLTLARDRRVRQVPLSPRRRFGDETATEETVVGEAATDEAAVEDAA